MPILPPLQASYFAVYTEICKVNKNFFFKQLSAPVKYFLGKEINPTEI